MEHENLKNLLSIYIWYQPDKSDRIEPNKLSYSNKTPLPDLANVFHYTAKIAKKIFADITCAKTQFDSVVFKISIPCGAIQAKVSESGNEVPQPLHLSKHTEEDTPLKYVLIVDDEKDLRTILSMKIAKIGYAPLIASNISEAKKILTEKDVELVVTDLFLAQESGLELFKELKTLKPDLPFIFISGADADEIPETIHDIMTKYGNGFLSKPIPTILLKETLNKILPL